MPYATALDFIAHFGRREATAVSDRDRLGEPNTDELERLIELASAEADSHIGRRYALPLARLDGTAVFSPLPLKLAVMNVARYLGTGTEIMSTDEIRNRYKDARAWLEGVAAGTVLLGPFVPAGAGGAAPTGGATAVRTGAKVFSDLSGAL